MNLLEHLKSKGEMMNTYQKPFTYSVTLQSRELNLQNPTGFPLTCDGVSNCDGFPLGGTCLGNELEVNFFLQGSDSSDPPQNCVVIYNNSALSNALPFLLTDCSAGAVWQLVCSCVSCTSFEPFSIQCSGVEQLG